MRVGEAVTCEVGVCCGRGKHIRCSLRSFPVQKISAGGTCDLRIVNNARGDPEASVKSAELNGKITDFILVV